MRAGRRPGEAEGGAKRAVKIMEDIMDTKIEVIGSYKYEQDSRRYHRFKILTDEGVIGTVYIPKELDPFPKRIVLDLVTDD